MDPRIDNRFSMYPLSADEVVTCQSMLQDEHSKVTIMPTHHVNYLGDMMGFRFECGPFLTANNMPIVRTMFHGHTVVECQASEETIMKIMSCPEENRGTMLKFLQRVDAESVPATLDCVPENSSSMTLGGVLEAQGLLSVDR
jgi:hypothetical protein